MAEEVNDQPVSLTCRICGEVIQRVQYGREPRPWAHVNDYWEPMKNPFLRSQYDHEPEPDVIDVDDFDFDLPVMENAPILRKPGSPGYKETIEQRDAFNPANPLRPEYQEVEYEDPEYQWVVSTHKIAQCYHRVSFLVTRMTLQDWSPKRPDEVNRKPEPELQLLCGKVIILPDRMEHRFTNNLQEFIDAGYRACSVCGKMLEEQERLESQPDEGDYAN